jgi:hypothetical protein
MCFDPEIEKFAAIVIKIDDIDTDDLKELAEKVEKWATKKVDTAHVVQTTRDRDAKDLYELSSYDPTVSTW